MDDVVTAAVKDDDGVLDRIAGEVADLLGGFPMPGWHPTP
jgi:glycine hydroxymethyltransferase